MDQAGQKVFVVYNPKSGEQVQIDEFRSTLEKYFTSPQWTIEIYEITGEDNVTDVCREACEQGASLVVSAGGDGTLLSVANALMHYQVPLGILPMGTGNLLARILNIPTKLDEAVRLLTDEHSIIEIDALKTGERYFLSNVSVGISPSIMGETTPTQKKRFGMLAYFWTIIKQSSLLNLHRYLLTIDGQTRHVWASEVLISNTKFLEKATSLYGPPETLNDGQFEVYLAAAHNLKDILRLAWDLIRGPGKPGAKLFHWESHHDIRIDAYRTPRLVQGDGEVIGHTPVEVKVVSKAVQVIMPKVSSAQA